MLNAMIWFHWRSCRAWIVAAAFSAAALPVVSVVRSWPREPGAVPVLLGQLDAWGVFYPVLAAALGLSTALIVWQADHRGRFVYALTLPVRRWRYVWFRFVAAAAWIVVVGLVLWVAALTSVGMLSIPPSLRTFPTALAVKFVLAALSVFAAGYCFTALPAPTQRILGRAVLALLVVQVGALLLGMNADWLSPLASGLFGRWGPFALLGGRWMLIDV